MIVLFTLIDTRSLDENFDNKNIQSEFETKSNSQSQHNRIEYPVKQDQSLNREVEKCLEFYYKIREYFDDDISAMLLKCCLCYGDCFKKK